MPGTLAIITAVILERPLCLACVAEKVGLRSDPSLEARLAQVEQVLNLHREEGRCRVCGVRTTVVSVARPA